MNAFFITGVYRSGTTLLANLVNSHPDAKVLLQPGFSMFAELKNSFYRSKEISKAYPIDPAFPCDEFSWEELYGFMDSFRELKQLPEIKGNKDKGTFMELFLQMLQHYGSLSTIGSKEILCEEFLPYFLRNGIKCIQIIRDPRDIICSTNFGKGESYTGKIRPLLYTLRLWRKSVAFALHNLPKKNFKVIRYEDLVADPENEMENVFEFLNLKKTVLPALGSWKGNSSFSEATYVSDSSVGNYKRLLDSETIRYIEFLCKAELDTFGYEVTSLNLKRELVETYKEPFEVTHPVFDPAYTSRSLNRTQELRRIDLLEQPSISPEEQRMYFYFPEVYSELKKSIDEN